MKGLQYSWSSKRTSTVQIQTLPNDLLIEILSRLPVRSLARFQCLSKYWYGVMKTPFFIDNHRLKRGKNGRMLLLRRHLLQDDVLSFHDLDNPEREVTPNLSISFMEGLRTRYWGGSLRILGACNGIVCIMRDGCVTLCNPALREFKLLPPLPFDYSEGYVDSVIGAGFGISCSGEFKIILMRTYTVWSIENQNQHGPFPSHLYTSSTNSWKLIDDSLVRPLPTLHTNELFFNGACHWTATSYENLFSSVILIYFNMNTEVFGQLELPDALSRDIVAMSPMVFNERLSVVGHARMRLEAISIWVMGEYGVKESWTLQFIIHPQTFISPLLGWKNDESLLVEEASDRGQLSSNPFLKNETIYHGQLSSISFLTNETIRYDIHGVNKNTRALIYEETLVRLNQGKTLEEMVSLAKTADSSLLY